MLYLLLLLCWVTEWKQESSPLRWRRTNNTTDLYWNGCHTGNKKFENHRVCVCDEGRKEVKIRTEDFIQREREREGACVTKISARPKCWEMTQMAWVGIRMVYCCYYCYYCYYYCCCSDYVGVRSVSVCSRVEYIASNWIEPNRTKPKRTRVIDSMTLSPITSHRD